MTASRISMVAILLLLLACSCTDTAKNRSIGSDEAMGLRLIEENLKQPAGAHLTDAEIRTILQDNVDGAQADGLVVGIVDERGPRVISAGVMGTATTRPVDGDTLFRIGSITKLFTALLLQDMIERGEMKLDDTVQRYLPNSVKMPMRGGKQVTLFDLAAHTSGLPREWSDVEGPSHTIEQLYAKLSRCKLRHDPGTHYEYSNLGVALLGHVIALKAGRDYETLVVERICRPLGMDSTRITLSPPLEARLATGHGFAGRPVEKIRGQSLFPGAGSIKSTANDLLKFVAANLGLIPSPLTPLMKKLHAVQQTSSRPRARLVWFEEAGVLIHGGLVPGFRANLGFDPARRRGVVILANCSSSRVPPGLLMPLLDNRSPRPPKVASIDQGLLDNYVGLYQFAGPTRSASILFAQRIADRLVLQVWNGQPPYPMGFPTFEVFPQSQTVFYNHLNGIRITFVRDAGGRVNKLILNSPREGVEAATAKKISPQPLEPYAKNIDPADFDGFVGQYRPAVFGLIPFGPRLNIYLKHDELGPHLFGYAQTDSSETLQGELFPFSRSTLYSPDLDDCAITFRRDKAGKATSLTVQLNNRQIRGVRVSDDPQTPDH